MDELRTELERYGHRRIVHAGDASAEAIASLEHNDGPPGPAQRGGGG
jgi:hypothetical protein